MNYPLQAASRAARRNQSAFDHFDMRDWLAPNRMTVIMWDFAFLTRHVAGDAFENYDKVLDEAIERGYNTLRLDPMVHAIDLAVPERLIGRTSLIEQPLHPWDRHDGFEGPLGLWLIEFMEKLLQRNLYYTISAWNMLPFVDGWQASSLRDITEKWKVFLRQWKMRFGFQNCVYVDLSNEYPFFLNRHLDRTVAQHNGRWSPEWNEFTRHEVNSCLRELRQEFPELRFMVSLHGDLQWINLGLELDVMDIHFYADSDPRFSDRTLFDLHYKDYFTTDAHYADFSRRCQLSHAAMAPMYRARQRTKLAAFADWSREAGIPLVTTESWASWFYNDHKDLDWAWLLEWAEWSVEDAIDFDMWGWTPHNYCQPQFENWKDVRWHRRLTDRFLKS